MDNKLKQEDKSVIEVSQQTNYRYGFFEYNKIKYEIGISLYQNAILILITYNGKIGNMYTLDIEEEDKKILELYAKYGKAWSGIACELPGRTADMVKNRFYCTLKYYIKKENILLGKKRKEDGKVKFEVRNCTITNNQSNINSNNQQDNFSVCQNAQIMFSPFITWNNFDNSRYNTIPQGTYLNNTTIVLLDSYNQSKIKNSSIKESYSFLSDNMNFQEEIKQKDEVALGNVYIKGKDVKKKIDISSNLDALKALIQREQDKTCVAMQLKLLNEIKTQIEIKESCFN